MGTIGSLGSVTATFTGDSDSLIESTKELGNQLEKTGEQATAAAKKVEQAGQATDRASKVQERAIERARAAWQRELYEQMHVEAAQNAASRAKELAALKADILSRATQDLGNSMEASVSKTMAASAALRVTEGNVTNNIRAAERFVSILPGMSSLLEAAFPVIGAVALLGVLSELKDRVIDAFDLMGKRAEKTQEDIRGINQEMEQSLTELDVQIEKLKEEQAKLEKKPFNGLKLVLDEAAASAQQLSERLNEVIMKTRSAVAGMAASDPQQLIGQVGTGYEQTMLTEHAKWLAQAKNNQEQLNESTSYGNSLQARLNELKERQAALDKAAMSSTGETGIVTDYKREIDAVQMMIEEQQKERERIQKTMELAVQQELTQHLRDGAGVHKIGEAASEELHRYLTMLHELYRENDKLEEERNKLNHESIDMVPSLLSGAPELENGKEQTDLMKSRLEGARAIQAANEEAARAQAEWNLRMAESTGLISKQQAAIARDVLAVQALQQELARQEENRQAALAHPELWTPKWNPEVFGAQEAQTRGQLNVAQSQLDLDQKQATFAGAMRTMFDEWIQKATDLRGQMSELWSSTTNSLNDALVKLMVDPPKNRQHLFRDTGKQIFTGIAKTGLQDAEGFALGGLLGHNPMAKLGTKGNPMWTKSADVAAVAGGIGASPSGGGLDSDSGAGSGSPMGGLGGFLANTLPMALGFLADGGDFSPGTYMVGERGPEIMSIPRAGRMHTNAESRRMMSGGDTHHHFNNTINIHNASDPAAVRRAVNQALQEAAPHMIAAAVAIQTEHRARRPTQPPAY